MSERYEDSHKVFPYKDREGWWHPICCNCRNRRNLEVCRDTAKSGSNTIEDCEGYVKILQWR